MPVTPILQNKYRNNLSSLIVLPKVAWTFYREDIEGMFPIPEDMPFEDIWFSFFFYTTFKKVENISLPLYLYRQHDSQTFGNIDDFSDEKIAFRYKRLFNALSLIQEERHFNHFAKEIDQSKCITLFMLKETDLSSLFKKTGLNVFFKHWLLRDFRFLYSIFRKLLWFNRKLFGTSRLF